MLHTNYVDLNFIIEKFNEAKIPNSKMPETRIKEAIFTAISLLDNMELYDINIIELKANNGVVELPKFIHKIYKITGSNGELLTLTKSGTSRLSSKNSISLVRNRIYVPKSVGGLLIKYIGVPLDDNRNPLVLDNEYVINAVISYLVYISARSLWLSNRLSSEKYRDIEQDWLFRAPSAQEDLSVPSVNDTEEWDSIFQAFPLSRLEGI